MKSKVSISLTKNFQKEFKRLVKNYPSLKNELTTLRDLLQIAPKTGKQLGNNIFKIRLAIKSKGTGKSGGARVISKVDTELIARVENKIVTLVTIYDKSEVDTISTEKILALIKSIEF